MTPSSSAGVSSSMMPVVAQTVAFLGERPSANAFGIDVLATATFGLGRSACTHRRSIIACSCGASCGRDDAAAHRGQRELVGREQVQRPRARPRSRSSGSRSAGSTRSTTASTTYTAPSRNMVTAIRTCSPVSLPNEVGLGICMRDFGRRAAGLINIYRLVKDLHHAGNRAIGSGGSLTLGPLMRLRLVLAALLAVVLPFASGPCLPVGSSADSPLGRSRRRSIATTSLIGGHKARERVLTTDISRQTERIDTLQSDITRAAPTSRRSCRRRWTPSARQLAAVQRKLRAERARLTRLRARLLVVRRQLAARLVELYKADKPDLVDRRARGRRLRGPAHPHRVHEPHLPPGREDHEHRRRRQGRTRRRPPGALDKLEKAEAKVARGDRVRSATRSPRSASASSTAATGSRPRARPSSRCCAARAIAATSSRTTSPDAAGRSRRRSRRGWPSFSGPASTAGPVKPGSGGLIWPVNGPITSPFCESRAWESCHPGIDIGVPAGTPIRAAASGKVVLMQPESASGGYGNFTCIQHGGSLSTCYAHQSRFGTSRGRVGHAGPGHRLRWVHRPVLRGPPALRDPDQRRRGEPHELPVVLATRNPHLRPDDPDLRALPRCCRSSSRAGWSRGASASSAARSTSPTRWSSPR